MIQYDEYKTPSSKEEEPDHFHAQAVSKGVITYDLLKKDLEYASSATPRKDPLLSREGPRNSSSIFPRPGVSTRCTHDRYRVMK